MSKELTPTQTKIIALLAKGFKNEEISEEIGMCRKTLYVHLQEIKKRLRIRRRVLLAFHALQTGIITQEEINEAIATEQGYHKD